ncbi:MAG: peptide deformylase [Mycobacterium sp.]
MPAPDAVDSPQPDWVASGSARSITIKGAAVLAQRCKAVTVFDDALRHLIADMFASMYQAGGVGLAANQIGVDARIFVIDCPDERGHRLVAHVVNPEIEILDPTPTPGGEGCLSVPGPRAEFPRPYAARVVGTDAFGDPVVLEGEGLASRCLQHETDHLDGHLYLDRLSLPERNRVSEEFNAARLEASGFGSAATR